MGLWGMGAFRATHTLSPSLSPSGGRAFPSCRHHQSRAGCGLGGVFVEQRMWGSDRLGAQAGEVLGGMAWGGLRRTGRDQGVGGGTLARIRRPTAARCHGERGAPRWGQGACSQVGACEARYASWGFAEGPLQGVPAQPLHAWHKVGPCASWPSVRGHVLEWRDPAGSHAGTGGP